MLHDLAKTTSWQSVTPVDFTIESHETDPQLMQILAPNEAVVAVNMEVRIGDNAGNDEHRYSVDRCRICCGTSSISNGPCANPKSTETEQSRILKLIKPSMLNLDTRLSGPTLRVEDLLDIEVDDVLTFDYPVNRALDLTVNGVLKYRGNVINTGRNRGYEVAAAYKALE